jgi:hypothetical protein
MRAEAARRVRAEMGPGAGLPAGWLPKAFERHLRAVRAEAEADEFIRGEPVFAEYRDLLISEFARLGEPVTEGTLDLGGRP